MQKHLIKLCFLLLVPLLFGVNNLTAQTNQKFTISGYIQDEETSEKLINARIFETKSLKGAITNNYGFYSLTLPAGEIELKISYAGYQTQTKTLELDKNQAITFSMGLFQIDAVEIVAEEEQRIEEKTEMSTIDISVNQIKSLPALLGEVDVIKAIQLMPGVQSGSEGTTGLYVRGGGPDQNLILLDGVPLYYVSHLGGFFSVFNADALSSVKLVKGGFPARYGGRLSSVLDVRMKEGNMNKFQGEGSIGIISSKLSFQGPINKGKTSFIVSGRRTYFDLFSRPISKIASKGSSSFGYFFHDFNGKINHTFSEKDRLFFSFYIGDDKLGLTESFKNGNEGDADYNLSEFKSGLGWGNDLAALRWNHIWSPKLFSNLTATYSNYKLGIRYDERSEFMQQDSLVKNKNFFEYRSGIRDWATRLDFDYYPSPAHDIKFGISSTFHKFSPGSLGYQLTNDANQDTTIKSKIHNTVESAIYLEDNIKIGNRFSANLGVRGVQYLVNDKQYYSFEPRAALRFQIAEKVSFKASYAQMTQFIHLLTNSTIGLPIDLWVTATDLVPPQKSWQAAAGIATSLWNDQLEVSVEGYYKEMDGLIAYKEGNNFFLGGISQGSWENVVETGGKGEAYGAELLVQKKKGNTTGWIGYTLSWNNRHFDNLNQGEWYPYRYDRRHDLSIVVSHKFNEKISVSATWVYGTGNAITLPGGKHSTLETSPWGSQGNTGSFNPISIASGWYSDLSADLFEEGRNGFRMQDYHRLDVGINLRKETKWGERTWNFGVYNAYSRLNPFAYYIRSDYDYINNEPGDPKLKKIALFPIIPSVSYSFKF